MLQKYTEYRLDAQLIAYTAFKDCSANGNILEVPIDSHLTSFTVEVPGYGYDFFTSVEVTDAFG